VRVDGMRLCLWTAATNGPIVHPPRHVKPQWNAVDRGNWITLRKTCPSATLSATNSTRTNLGANPDLRADRPATNSQNRDTDIPYS
jgi:hypothetical protein